ncbi:hypothetical protein [Acinetobacter sp. H1(2024)]|uniref:hypothetical protein n=1 Tax=Acinetobacter sp. H1(2024) TaxID=3390190 RepID=UPI00397B7706
MTLSKTDINRNLKQLKLLYDAASSSRSSNASLHMTFYSKLALLEYCGWLEISIDILIRRIISKVSDPKIVEIGNEWITQNYGFSYKQHFRSLLCKSLGLQKTERILNRLQVSGDLAILESKLNSFKTLRNEAAHNPLNSNHTYRAPDYYVSEVEIVYPIFQKIKKYL